MRTLKFRAWDTERKIILDWRDFKPQYSIFTFNNKDFWFLRIMQYTGLKAKGVEIYEGDILRWTLPAGTRNQAAPPRLWGDNCIDEETTTISQVVYKDACFYLEGVGVDTGWEAMLRGGINRDEYAEVIGNICENPELLEE